MTQRISIVGQKFERLLVTAQVGMWAKCDCDCGTKNFFARSDKLKDGSRKSCGCILQDRINAAKNRKPAHKPKAIKQKETKSADVRRLMAVWNAMMQRCYNSNNKDFKYYGGRGVAVCQRWHNRDAFLFDMAAHYRVGLWLERHNNDRGYGPNNCTFRTPKAQSRNRSNTLFILLTDGSKATLPTWATRNGIAYAQAYSQYCRLRLSGDVYAQDLLAAIRTRCVTILPIRPGCL